MTLSTFISDNLPALAKALDQAQCDHVLISSQGRWNIRARGTWSVQETTIAQAALKNLANLCTGSPSHSYGAFTLHALGDAPRVTFAFTRTERALSLPDEIRDTLLSHVARGDNGVILGPHDAPKSALLDTLVRHSTCDPAFYVSTHAPHNLPDRVLCVPPRTPALRALLTVAEATFWDDVRDQEMFLAWASHAGSSRKWCSMDVSAPDVGMELLATYSQSPRTLDHIVWLEPYYHTDRPPIVLSRQDGTWSTSSTSALARTLTEHANLHLPVHTVDKIEALDLEHRLTLDTSQSKSAVSTLQPKLISNKARITSENPMMTTLSGLGSHAQRDEPEDELTDATEFDRHDYAAQDEPLQQITTPAMNRLSEGAVTHDMAAPQDHAMTSELPHQESAGIRLDELGDDMVDSEPDIIEEEAIELATRDIYYDELPDDPLAVTTAISPSAEAPPELLNELAHDSADDPTAPISRKDIIARYGDMLKEDETANSPAPFEELKRMERELMTASHSDPTGVHPDFIDDHNALDPDEVSTSVKGATDIPIPDDPEVFTSLNAPDPPARPQAPEGIWQPAIADEPTQISFEHTNFAQSSDEALSWDDDENTTQRSQADITPPLPSAAETSTTSKLSTLSDRIKALRQRQRQSGQFDAQHRGDQDPS